MLMKQYQFNDRINFLEVDVQHLEAGLTYAEGAVIDSIHIRLLDSPTTTKYDLDFLPFENKTFVKRLIIHDSLKIGKVKNVEVLYTIPLTYLQVMQVFPVDLGFFRQLKSYYFEYDAGIKNIDALENIEDVLVHSLAGEDCSFLQGIQNITRLLRLKGSFKSLCGLENLKKLSKLSIFYNAKLADAEAIKSMPALTSLHVEKCKLLTDFSFLKDNESIEELFLTEVASLDFIRSMKKLKKIHIWDCHDGDMNPILENPCVKIAYITKNKKHYTHTQEEIDLIVKNR